MMKVSGIRLLKQGLVAGILFFAAIPALQAQDAPPPPAPGTKKAPAKTNIVETEVKAPSEVFTSSNSYAGNSCGSSSCGGGCCDVSGDGCGLGCGGGGCLSGGCSLLGGLFKSSEPCFNDFISPMTNPTFFEDPRTLSEVRSIFIHHKLPDSVGGGRVNLIAHQIRLALTERLSLIATKDGFAMSTSPLIDDGWADVSLGLKYNFYRDVQSQTLASAGFTYEAPVGTPRTLQGNGDGEAHFFLTGGTEFAEDWHWISAIGFRLPIDQDAESTTMYLSTHVDKKLTDGFYLFAEANWYHWLKSGDGGVPGVEGGDLFNLGSTGVTGNDIVTGAVGFKVKPSDTTEIGVAYELPLTNRRDVMKDRLTVDFIYRF